MPSFADNVGQGIFVPTTNNFDVTNLEGKDLGSPEFREFIIRLTQAMNIISLTLNLKDSAIYSLEEFVNSQVYFPNPNLSSTTAQFPEDRQVFRKVINFVDGTVVTSLPNAGTTSVPHGITITNDFTFTRIYATATEPGTSFIPIPYSSATAVANNIEINVDATNVNITTGSDRTNYTFCYVVLEYIKQ